MPLRTLTVRSISCAAVATPLAAYLICNITTALWLAALRYCCVAKAITCIRLMLNSTRSMAATVESVAVLVH